ncbi:MAG: ATP-dependent sacrificial sulfur transferase LarE [Lachnospiraceae bacterium]|nr:ATP-dependent sacrificial sulfur transferase LarE [Lachnospiraceae bacterium]
MDQTKLNNLRAYLKEKGSIAVAFSAGVDSTFLLKVAHDTLGDKCIAITGMSAAVPDREQKEATEFCQKEGIRQLPFYSNELEDEDYVKNPTNRCYYCKHILFSGMKKLAEENGIAYVAEGSNMDDRGDYRPGLKAIEELGILSPLQAVGLTKAEIRDYSKEMNLPTWDKPSFACLASRFVYGETITAEKLKKVEKAEALLADLGLRQYRVRIHENLARIEVAPADFPVLMKEDNRLRIVREFKEYGFSYVSLDLQGFRSGSMNEVLHK